MPTYSYRCTKCNSTFDAFHSMSCKDPQHCPDCGGEGTKLLSASSVIFKGSGFYSTDYRDSGYLEAKKKDGNGTSKPESKPDSSATPAADASTPAKKAETPAASPAPATPAPAKTPPTAQAA